MIYAWCGSILKVDCHQIILRFDPLRLESVLKLFRLVVIYSLIETQLGVKTNFELNKTKEEE